MITNKPLPPFKETPEEMHARCLPREEARKMGYTLSSRYGTTKIVLDQDHRREVPADELSL